MKIVHWILSVPRRFFRRNRLRAESGIRGYRGIIVVIVLIGMVGVIGLTGIARHGICLLDISFCSSASSVKSISSAIDPGELPAPTDERAINSGAGLVPPGHHRRVQGKRAVLPPGPPSDLGSLWAAGQDEQEQSGTQKSSPWSASIFLSLDALSCGTTTTCDALDAAQGLPSDSTAGQTQGASRLSLLGLDPFVGNEQALNIVDLSLPKGNTILAAPGNDPLLYRHSQRLRDGMTIETWTWKDTADLNQVCVERTREGILRGLSMVGVRTSSAGQTRRTTVQIPVTDANRDALDVWITGFAVDGPVLPSGVFEPTKPVGADGDVILRLTYSKGQVTRETLTIPSGSGGLTSQTLRDDPGLRSMPPVASETLGAPDKSGRRTFSSGNG